MTHTEQIDQLNDQAWDQRFSDPAAAAELAGRAERLSREGDGYPRGLGWSLLTAGVCAIRREEYDAAHTHLAAALELLAGCGDADGEAYTLVGLGNLNYLLGEYRRALENDERGLEIFRRIDHARGEAIALTGLGSVQYALGEYALALASIGASREIFRSLGDRLGEANTLNNLGNVHYALGDYQQALAHLEAAVPIHREIGNRSGEASTLGNIGGIHYSLGAYPLSLEHHQANLRIQQDLGNREGEAYALNNIGGVDHAIGNHRQALEHLQASLEIFSELGHLNGQATVLVGIGLAHGSLEEHESALKHYQAGLHMHRETGNRSGEAHALVSMASAHAALGETGTAVGELEAAAEIARQIGSRPQLAHATLILGRTRLAMDQPEAALDTLTSALSLAVEIGEKSLELEACNLISSLHESMGNTRDALTYLRRYLELRETVLGEETRRRVYNLETSWEIELARKEAEIERLRSVELKEAFDRLDHAHSQLEHAHAELKSAQSSLVQSEKMASLGQLTAGIAHEINNPINFVSSSVGPLRRDLAQIRGAIDAIGGRLPDGEYEEFRQEEELEDIFSEIDQLLGSIDSGAARTAEIVAGLRSFSRLDEGGLKRVDLHEGLDAALTILSGSISEGIVLVREYGDLPEVECYPGEINQVFMNILTNAIRAIDGEGRVRITSEAVEGAVRITIADSGEGMSEEVRARIFEPFYTTRDVGEGRGLGLSIAWGIVEKHGGTIEVESAPGAGSSFVVLLPLDR